MVYDFDLLQLVIPPGRSDGSGTEYPMFVFCNGNSRDAQKSPKRMPPSDLEYSMDSSIDGDDMGTEAFEII